jgi:hypothetical protein
MVMPELKAHGGVPGHVLLRTRGADHTAQVLRGSAKPLQSWKHEHTPLATERLLELVDREAAVLPFPL